MKSSAKTSENFLNEIYFILIETITINFIAQCEFVQLYTDRKSRIWFAAETGTS